jgi:hypothetical protein
MAVEFVRAKSQPPSAQNMQEKSCLGEFLNKPIGARHVKTSRRKQTGRENWFMHNPVVKNSVLPT